MQITKQLKNSNSFSIIEIIIALAFSGIILTTFIGLSSWALNNTKDNEVEDISSQSLIEFNDLLRTQNDINAETFDNTSTEDQYYTINYPATNSVDRTKLIKIDQSSGMISNDGYTFSFDVIQYLSNCLANSSSNDPAMVVYTDSSGTISSQYRVCILAKISKVITDQYDYRYIYTINVLAEKSGSTTFQDSIDGIRIGKIISYDPNSP